MVENELKAKLQRIFGMEKVTFDLPADGAVEQDVMFIEIEDTKTTVNDGMVSGRITGNIMVDAQWEKIPVGFFQKRISTADPSDSKGFFFFDVDQNRRMIRNLVQRSSSFVYFFSGQHDPAVGNIEGVTLTQETN